MDQVAKTKKIYTLKEACSALHISLPTGKRWIRDGKLFAHRIGGRWMVPDEEIQKFLCYKVSRETAMPFANAPLGIVEAGLTADVVAAALRQVGAPLRKDLLAKMILERLPPDPVFWRFLGRLISGGGISPGEKMMILRDLPQEPPSRVAPGADETGRPAQETADPEISRRLPE